MTEGISASSLFHFFFVAESYQYLVKYVIAVYLPTFTYFVVGNVDNHVVDDDGGGDDGAGAFVE